MFGKIRFPNLQSAKDVNVKICFTLQLNLIDASLIFRIVYPLLFCKVLAKCHGISKPQDF